MIIDLILDRYHDGNYQYDPEQFYRDVRDYRESFPNLSDPITLAMDYGEEADVREALCRYIDRADYNPRIKNYINAVRWLEPCASNDTNVKILA